MEIPWEIYMLIILNFKQKDVFKLRLVSKEWDRIIRKFYPIKQRGISKVKFANVVILQCVNIRYDFPSLTNLHTLKCLFNTFVSDDDLKHLTNLTYLDCCWNNKITNTGIKHLRKLKHLDCGFNTQISDEGIMHLRNLEYLNCGNCIGITSYGIRYLTNLTKLECIDMQISSPRRINAYIAESNDKHACEHISRISTLQYYK